VYRTVLIKTTCRINEVGMVNFELAILDVIQSIRFPALDFVMKYVTHLGDAGLLFIVLTLLLLSFKKTRVYGAVCATALILDFLSVNLIIKPLVARERPFVLRPDIVLLVARPLDYSFPSGHAAASFAFASAVGAYGKKYRPWAYALAVIIAFSRLYLYLHFASDVLAGAAIGFLCGYAARLIWRRSLNKAKR